MLNTAKKKSFKDEIRKSFILYTLIPTLLLSFFFYNMLLTQSIRMLKKSNMEKNNNVANLIEESFISYLDEMDSLSKSPKLARIIEYNDTKNTWIYETLYRFVNKQNVRSVFYLLDSQGNIVITSAWKNAVYSQKEIKELGILDDKYEKNNVKLFLNKSHSDRNTRRIYSLSKKVMNKNGKTIGYILFDLLDNEFNNIVYRNKSDIFVVTDLYQNSIVTTNSLVLDYFGKFKASADSNGYTEIDNEKYFMSKTGIIDDNIFIYTLTSMEFMNNFYITGLMFLVVIFIFLMVITYIVSKKFANTRTKYIYDLINSIKKIKEGNFNTKVDIKSNDEFETLGNYYNEMTMQLHDLIEKNKKQVQINKIAELKQLEAQFNPHFLFNTLETLKYMIKIEPQSAIKIVVSMANLLRYSINYEIEKIKLSDDIKYIEDYFIIQKYRFNMRFDYSIEVAPEAQELMVPKLLIQPIIENCFKYGFENKAYLTVQLKCLVENNNLILKVIDSGSGIEKDELSKIKRSLDQDLNLSNNLGLYNVHKRIKLMYGADYGLDVQSIKYIKTEVTIIMPRIEDNHD